MTSLEHFLSSQVDKNRTPGLQYYFFNQDDILYSYYGGLIGTGSVIMFNRTGITDARF